MFESKISKTSNESPRPLNFERTPKILSKKHVNFGQGLEFLKFGQGNRGPNQQNRRKTEEKIRKNEGNQRKFDKKIRDRDPYFLFKIFLFNIFSVF